MFLPLLSSSNLELLPRSMFVRGLHHCHSLTFVPIFHQFRTLHIAIMPPKRKPSTIGHPNGASKRFRSSESRSPERFHSRPHPDTDPLRQPHPFFEESEENGIVL